MPPINSNYPFPSGNPQQGPFNAATQPPVNPVVGGSASQMQTAKPKVKNPNSSQNSLALSEVRDNIVVMADGSIRAVVACQSINFELMSNAEREGIEFSYQNFINSLSHPIQILIRSQRIDIAPYIDKLVNIRSSQDNMLLNVIMDEYIGFIDALAQEANIMQKSFYVVIPYYPAGDASSLMDQGKGFFGKILNPGGNRVTKIDKPTYLKAKEEIHKRVEGIMSGLFQIGIQCVQLNTKQLGELYYNFYNPDTAVREPLGNFNNLTSIYTKKADGTQPRPGVTNV